MKSLLKKHKNCKKTIEVKLPAEKVREEFDRVYGSIKKIASIPGYRTGNAPRDLLELHYGKTAREDVIKKLVPDTYRNAIEEHKLDPIGFPDITDLKLDIKEGFSYTANIETRPEFSLRNYKGLKVKKKNTDVKEDEVKKNLESLRDNYAQKATKDEGEKKEKTLPRLDDDFARDLGFEGLDKLKEAIRTNLKNRLEQESRADTEMQIVNQLVDSVNFELPESLVKAEKERLLKDAENRIAYMEEIQKKQNPEKKFTLSDKDKKELEANSQKQAERQVKAFFILDRIAQAEKIQISQEEIDSHIEEIARQYQKSNAEIRKHLEERHMLDEMAVNMRNAKVMEFLIKEAKIL